ncbi:MAG: ABC transporter ATP-binding protein [Bacteroidales bacterium]|nr:ABC transporter ATP-binding protein [Bacteroidales bacterium]
MIQLERISKIYGELPKQAIALKNVDLKIGKAEFIVVRGPSGSGKTTLLMSIGGMLQPSSGTVRINDKDIYLLSIVERSRFRALNIGFVFQMFHLIPYLSVLENIILSTRHIKYDDSNKKAYSLIEDLGLSDRINYKPSELSAGECQRVALGRALIHRPKIILADEPTGNLDPENSSIVMKTFSNYHQNGGTVIIVTHGEDADPFADRVIYLKKGEIK